MTTKTPSNQLPKKLNILGSTYKIQYTTRQDEVDVNGREPLWGQIDFLTNTIRIYTGMNRPTDGVWKVVFHEMIHGILAEYNIYQLMGIGSEGQLELITDTIANSLYDTLTRNKLVTLT